MPEGEVNIRRRHCPVSHRVVHINLVRQIDWRDEISRLCHLERLHDVREQESVHVDHHRQQHSVILSNSEGHQCCIVCFLDR